MAFKTFAPGVLTSSDVNTFLMRQAVITCTSSTRPASPSEGMTIYETDTNIYKVYDGSNWLDLYIALGGAWTSYTPTTQGWTAGNAVFDTTYVQVGKVVHYRGRIEWGSTSSLSAAPTNLYVSLPVAPDTNPEIRTNIGTHFSWDISLAAQYLGFARLEIQTGNWLMLNPAAVATNDVVSDQYSTTNTPFTPVAGDRFYWSVTYEAA